MNDLVDVPRAIARKLDFESTKRMSLNRALKRGDADDVERLSRDTHLDTTSIKRIRQIKDVHETDTIKEGLFDKQLVKELQNVEPFADPYEQISKLTTGQKHLLYNQLPSLKGKLTKYAKQKSISATEIDKIVNDALAKLIAHSAVGASASSSILTPVRPIQFPRALPPSPIPFASPLSPTSSSIASSFASTVLAPTVVGSPAGYAVGKDLDFLIGLDNSKNKVFFDPSFDYTAVACKNIIAKMTARYPNMKLDKSVFASLSSKTLVEPLRIMAREANAQIVAYNLQQQNISAVASSAPVPGGAGVGLRMRGSGRVVPKIAIGSLLIDKKKLRQSNLVSISDKTGRKVVGYPNVVVSDNLKKMLMIGKISNRQPIELTDGEKRYLHKLMVRANATFTPSKMNIVTSYDQDKDYDDETAELKERLQIAVGEIGAHNDNPQQLSEIATVLKKLIKNGTISKQQASEFVTKQFHI